MKDALLVGVGGFAGSVLRFFISAIWLKPVTARFPIGTFTVNVLGCLVAGLLLGLLEKNTITSPQTRVFLFTGVLGGFTTFSAFGVETMQLLRRGEVTIAAAYVAASLIVGLCFLALGLKFTGR